MKKTLFLIYAVFFLNTLSYAQNLTQEEIQFIIKITMFQESSGTKYYRATEESFGNFMKLHFKIDTIQAFDFFDFIFLKIDPKFANPENISIEEGPFFLCDEYIVALPINWKYTFRLKGFAENDFISFLNALRDLNYSNLNSRKQFVRNYSVEGLDLNCLYKSLGKFIIDRDKHPCLRNCFEMIYTH
jgi:hypothetical protein